MLVLGCSVVKRNPRARECRFSLAARADQKLGCRFSTRRGPLLAAAFVLVCGLGITALTALPAAAQGSDLYAYAQGGGKPSGCPAESKPATGCSLGEALNQAGAGDSILLATPGISGTYVGNWNVPTSGTSASEPLTIAPASGITNPTLSGNDGNNNSSCKTNSCEGSVLYLGTGVSLTIEGITIEDANTGGSTSPCCLYGGGAIDIGGGVADGTVTISDTTFSNNLASAATPHYNVNGGAIDIESGTLSVSDSTFTGDAASGSGGAIYSNSGTVFVSGSTFSGDSASSGENQANGGAIDNELGSLSVYDSTFNQDSAFDGGAIDNADDGNGDLTAFDSTFSDDSAGDGNEIDNGDNSGTGSVDVAGDIFNGTCDQAGGTWTDSGYNVGLDKTCFSASPPRDTTDSSLASQLGSLAWNGGPTQTILPIGSNPAIGLVPNETFALCPTTDQRGVSSVSGESCNSGSVQNTESFPPPTIGSVTIGGTQASPTVTVSGLGFGNQTSIGTPNPAKATQNCSSASGEDYGTIFYIDDLTQSFVAGLGPPNLASVGVIVSSYTNTQVVYTLGSCYGQNGWTFYSGDQFEMFVLGATYSGMISFPPVISSFSPASGPVGTTVTIRGTDLANATKVSFGGKAGTIKSDTESKIKVKVPNGAGTGKIKVTTAFGTATSSTNFTVT